MSQSAEIDPRGTVGEAVLTQLDQLLATLGSAEPSSGMEARIMARLKTEAQQARAREPRVRGPVFALAQISVRGWAPLAIAASLVCAVTGAMVVQRTSVTVLAPSRQISQQNMISAEGARRSLVPVAGSFGTAAARREPAGAVPVGTRKGRSTSHAAQTRPARQTRGRAAAPPPRPSPTPLQP